MYILYHLFFETMVEKPHRTDGQKEAESVSRSCLILLPEFGIVMAVLYLSTMMRCMPILSVLGYSGMSCETEYSMHNVKHMHAWTGI